MVTGFIMAPRNADMYFSSMNVGLCITCVTKVIWYSFHVVIIMYLQLMATSLIGDGVPCTRVNVM